MDREALLELLAERIVKVDFRKKNGDVREMYCTRDFDMIPEDLHPKGTGTEGPEHIIRVYDIEADGWRSFDIDSVLEVL